MSRWRLITDDKVLRCCGELRRPLLYILKAKLTQELDTTVSQFKQWNRVNASVKVVIVPVNLRISSLPHLNWRNYLCKNGNCKKRELESMVSQFMQRNTVKYIG